MNSALLGATGVGTYGSRSVPISAGIATTAGKLGIPTSHVRHHPSFALRYKPFVAGFPSGGHRHRICRGSVSVTGSGTGGTGYEMAARFYFR